MKSRSLHLVVAFTLAAGVGCGSSSPATTAPSAVTATASPTPTTATSAGLPAMYGQFYGTQTAVDGSVVVLRATSVPDHASPCFGPGHPGYEPPQSGMQVNPNRITAQDMVLRVPINPQITTASSDTPLGVMLAEFGRGRGIDPAHWRLLTGDLSEIQPSTPARSGGRQSVESDPWGIEDRVRPCSTSRVGWWRASRVRISTRP